MVSLIIGYLSALSIVIISFGLFNGTIVLRKHYVEPPDFRASDPEVQPDSKPPVSVSSK